MPQILTNRQLIRHRMLGGATYADGRPITEIKPEPEPIAPEPEIAPDTVTPVVEAINSLKSALTPATGTIVPKINSYEFRVTSRAEDGKIETFTVKEIPDES